VCPLHQSSQMRRRSFAALTPSSILLACNAASDTPHAGSTAHADDAQAEAQLRAFDLDSKFGGCIGLTRLERCGLGLPARPMCNAAQITALRGCSMASTSDIVPQHTCARS